MMNSDNFIHTLLADVPEFEASYQEHIADYDEILPHVLFGDLFDFLVAHQDNPDIVCRIVGFINRAAASSDNYIIGMVRVSFFEHVAFSELAGVVKPLLNETALALYEDVANWQPDETINITH
jgi:hypothetical protein